MGLFSNVRAISLVEKIKNGSTENITLAQITNLIINLPDAKNNLTKDQFKAVYKLYNDFQNCNSKIAMDLDGYYYNCVKIIKKFDAIAPYEKYSGGNELEFSFLMDEIRENKTSNKEFAEKNKKTANDYLTNFNFIEVDMMINQFSDFLALQNKSKNQPSLFLETELPFYHNGWKDTLKKATKIWVAYYVLWGKTQEYIEQRINLMQSINLFMPKENNNENRVNSSLPQIEFCGIDDVIDVYNHMLDYKNNVFLKQDKDTIFQAVADYCFEAYECAGVPYKEGYDIYFFTFKQMQKFAQMEQLKHYYVGYEEYISQNIN